MAQYNPLWWRDALTCLAGVPGALLADAAHECGHRLGCDAVGRPIQRWTLFHVDCGGQFTASEAWWIGLPAYLLPLLLGVLLLLVRAWLLRRASSGPPSRSWRGMKALEWFVGWFYWYTALCLLLLEAA
ncbi:MAG TPA: hypothetical protein VHN81_01600 [Edaphobacter sp.]|nr:hypothetical protein [Edaphobacter sp.]